MVYGIYRNNILKNIIDRLWRAGPKEMIYKENDSWNFGIENWFMGSREKDLLTHEIR